MINSVPTNRKTLIIDLLKVISSAGKAENRCWPQSK